MTPIKLIPRTDAEAFNLAVRHVLTMKGQAYDRETTECRYRVGHRRTAKGRCAIGAMIRDEDYRSELDRTGGTVTTCVGKGIITPGRLDIDVLRTLQIAHDEVTHWTDKKFNAKGVLYLAREFPERRKQLTKLVRELRPDLLGALK